MTTYYVNQFGSNTAPYTTKETGANNFNPFTYGGVQALSDGDEVVVCNGSVIDCSGMFTIRNIGVVIYAEDMISVSTRPILDFYPYPGGGFWSIESPSITSGGALSITGLVCRTHGDNTNVFMLYPYEDNDLIQIDQCFFYTASGLREAVQYINCEGEGVLVRQCVFANNLRAAIWQGKIAYNSVNEPTFAGNTFYHCGWSIEGTITYEGSNNLNSTRIYNNIFYQSTDQMAIYSDRGVYPWGGGADITCNLFYNTTNFYTPPRIDDSITGDVVGDPLFIDKDNNNFDIGALSPARGVGATPPHPGWCDYDYNYHQIFLDVPSDIGACQYYDQEPPWVFKITDDEYFDIKHTQQSNCVANIVKIKTSPLVPETASEIYKKTGLTLGVGASAIVDVLYSAAPVIGAVATIEMSDETPTATVSVTATYYAIGAYCVLTNTGSVAAIFDLVIDGQKLVVNGQETVTATDSASILANGSITYNMPDNHLLQSRAIAESISATLLLSLETQRRDMSVVWRGDPSLVLGDSVPITEYNRHGLYKESDYTIYKIKLDHNGTLKSSIEGRKT